MGKWMVSIGIAAAAFLYDPPGAMQQIDHLMRAIGLW